MKYIDSAQLESDGAASLKSGHRLQNVLSEVLLLGR